MDGGTTRPDRRNTADQRALAARLRHALEVADLGAWDLDARTGSAWRTLRHDQIFGYPEGRESWTYDDFLEHVHPDDRAAVDREFGGALATNGEWSFSCRIHRADGEERWISARGEVIVDRSGEPERIIGIVRDETEQHRITEALRSARDAAEEANRSKSEFLAMMSHELRTPLNAISGYAELLALGIHGPITDAQARSLERIQISQRHLLGLINDVLNYARLEAGKVNFDIQPTPVGEVLTAVEALIAPQAEARRLQLRVASAPGELEARVDADKLRQILLNLLSNAVKFTEPRGSVEISCDREGEMVCFSVRDTGIGIPPDKLANIFEPFVQVRPDLTRTTEGSGLGLAISRDLARAMDGELAVRSEVGVGSTFELRLPAA